MTLPGTIVAVAGSDPKAGSSMIAKSVGELLAKETGEAVLYLKKGPGSVVISPWNEGETGLLEAGLTHLLTVRWEDAYDELRDRFAFTVTDGGTEAVRGADRLLLVVNQLSSSIAAAESAVPLLAERLAAESVSPRRKEAAKTICLNRCVAGDPHDPAYLRRLFPDWNVLAFPESPKGREADWKGVTIVRLGDRPFRRAVKEGVKWILNN